MLKRIWEWLRYDLEGVFLWCNSRLARRGVSAILLAFFSPFIFIGFVVTLILTNWDANTKPILEYLNRNSLEVITNLPENSIRIDWNIDYVTPIAIYQEGQVTMTNFHELGNNYLSIFHEGQLIGKVMHYKTKQIAQHHYEFTIERNGDFYRLELHVEGTSDSVLWLYKRNQLK